MNSGNPIFLNQRWSRIELDNLRANRSKCDASMWAGIDARIEALEAILASNGEREKVPVFDVAERFRR